MSCLERNGKCIVTDRPHVRLNFYEYKITQKLMDFMITDQIVDTDIDTRELLQGLRIEAMKFIKIKKKLKEKPDG